MLRLSICIASVIFAGSALFAGSTLAAAVSGSQQSRAPEVTAPQCARDLATVDRSFADAMRDLQKTSAPELRCSGWRRQIEVMKKASDVFARCTSDEARKINLSQMAGSIADFRALIEEARCPQ